MKSGTSVGLSELSFTQRCGFDFYYLNTELCEKKVPMHFLVSCCFLLCWTLLATKLHVSTCTSAVKQIVCQVF